MGSRRCIDGVLLILCAACALFANAAFAEESDDKPLNVVWLSVEDMSPWIGPYGDKTVPTPNLDKLAKEGVVYDNAFDNLIMLG